MTASQADWLRLTAAAARYGVSTRTLTRWANRGLIGRSRLGQRPVYVRAADIEALIERGFTLPTVVSLPATATQPSDWRALPLWQGKEKTAPARG